MQTRARTHRDTQTYTHIHTHTHTHTYSYSWEASDTSSDLQGGSWICDPGYSLHSGYFLSQACDHSKEPQVCESICHPEIHHLQDLRENSQRVCLCVYVCTRVWMCVFVYARVCVLNSPYRHISPLHQIEVLEGWCALVLAALEDRKCNHHHRYLPRNIIFIIFIINIQEISGESKGWGNKKLKDK